MFAAVSGAIAGSSSCSVAWAPALLRLGFDGDAGEPRDRVVEFLEAVEADDAEHQLAVVFSNSSFGSTLSFILPERSAMADATCAMSTVQSCAAPANTNWPSALMTFSTMPMRSCVTPPSCATTITLPIAVSRVSTRSGGADSC